MGGGGDEGAGDPGSCDGGSALTSITAFCLFRGKQMEEHKELMEAPPARRHLSSSPPPPLLLPSSSSSPPPPPRQCSPSPFSFFHPLCFPSSSFFLNEHLFIFCQGCIPLINLPLSQVTRLLNKRERGERGGGGEWPPS